MIVDHFYQSVRYYCFPLDPWCVECLAIWVPDHISKHEYSFYQWCHNNPEAKLVANCRVVYGILIDHRKEYFDRIHTLSNWRWCWKNFVPWGIKFLVEMSGWKLILTGISQYLFHLGYLVVTVWRISVHLCYFQRMLSHQCIHIVSNHCHLHSKGTKDVYAFCHGLLENWKL